MIVVGSCYFLFTLLIPYDPNIYFVFPLRMIKNSLMMYFYVTLLYPIILYITSDMGVLHHDNISYDDLYNFTKAFAVEDMPQIHVRM